jgi:hypothetical protein
LDVVLLQPGRWFWLALVAWPMVYIRALEEQVVATRTRQAWLGDSVTGGRCYDHNFLRFLPIFGGKQLAFFLNTDVMIIFFFKIWLCFESKTPIFLLNFSAKIFLKIITSVSDWTKFRILGAIFLALGAIFWHWALFFWHWAHF